MLFGALIEGTGYTKKYKKESLGCPNRDLQEFDIMFERLCEGAYKTGGWCRRVEDGE